MSGDTSSTTSTRGRPDSMHSLVLISDNSVSVTFNLAASLSGGWLIDSAHDPAGELRSLRTDGFVIDLTAGELVQLESEVLLSAGAPQSGQLMLRRVMPVELSARTIGAWLTNNADIGCIFAADLRVDVIRPLVEGVEKRHGFATAGLLLESAAEQIAEMATVSIWPRCPDSDFDHNTLVLFRDQKLLEQVEAICADQGIVRCGTWQEAALTWRREPWRATCYVGPVELV